MCWHMPHYRTQFFCFCIHFHLKVPTLEAKPPPKMGPCPPTENSGSGPDMYVYSSLVKDSIVGDMFAPIVRVVGLEDKPKSETIHREFTVPHYLPLRLSSFNEVVLELTDGMGNSMKFNQGNSVAVFHFRKKSKI